jgi:hypothetical protein
LRDSAESDVRALEAGAAPKEPKPPLPFLAAKPPDGLGADDDDDDDDERCDENPLLKDGELDGLACAGADASDSVRHSANTTCAYFEMVFSMVRSAVES